MANYFDLMWFFFKTKGRIGRQTYILGNLFIGVIQLFPLYHFMLASPESGEQEFWLNIFSLFFIIFLWPNIVMAIKRLHDLGRSGIFALSLLAPMISIPVFILLCVLPSKIKGNSFCGETDHCMD